MTIKFRILQIYAYGLIIGLEGKSPNDRFWPSTEMFSAQQIIFRISIMTTTYKLGSVQHN